MLNMKALNSGPASAGVLDVSARRSFGLPSWPFVLSGEFPLSVVRRQLDNNGCVRLFSWRTSEIELRHDDLRQDGDP